MDVSAPRFGTITTRSVVTSAYCSISNSTAPVSAERLVPHRPARQPHRPFLGTTGAPYSHRRQRIRAPKIGICGSDLTSGGPGVPHGEVDRELRAPDRAVTGCPAHLDPRAHAHGGGWPADRRWCSGHRPPSRCSPEPSRCRLMTQPGRWPRHRHL